MLSFNPDFRRSLGWGIYIPPIKEYPCPQQAVFGYPGYIKLQPPNTTHCGGLSYYRELYLFYNAFK